MNIIITPRHTRDRSKIFYTLEWGKKAGQRKTTGIFTYTHPVNIIQKNYNTEALKNVEAKRAQLILEWQAIGTGSILAHKFKHNFLDYYNDYVHCNCQYGNRHLECSYKHFKRFIRTGQLCIADVTEDLVTRFRKYLMNHLNGETPANYFARFKRVLKAATKQSYFKVDPGLDIPAKANKNKTRKNHLEAEEYI